MAARSHHPVGGIVDTNPDLAAKKICAHLEANEGAMEAAAEALGVNVATLRRWVSRLRGKGKKIGPIRARGNPQLERAREALRKKQLLKRA